MNETRVCVKGIKANLCKSPGKMFLAEVFEAAAFTGRTEMLTAGTSGAVLPSMEKKQHMLLLIETAFQLQGSWVEVFAVESQYIECPRCVEIA